MFGWSFPAHWTSRRLPMLSLSFVSCCATPSVSVIVLWYTRFPRPKTRAFDCDHPIGEPAVASVASAVAGTE